MKLLGGHVSVTGGVRNAPERARAVTCDCMQIFSKNQMQWASKPLDLEDAEQYKANMGAHDISETVIHDSYLINLGSPDNALLKRSRDFSQVRFNGLLNRDVVDKALQLMGVDLLGLDESDRRILSAIINKHGGGPVGVETIAATAHEDIGTIEDVFEPFLMQIGFLKRTPRGRVATKKAYKHLGLSFPQSGIRQESLL